MKDGYGLYIGKRRVLETIDYILSNKEINSRLLEDLPWCRTVEGHDFWYNYNSRLWRKKLKHTFGAIYKTRPQKRTLLRLERIRSSILLGLEDNL